MERRDRRRALSVRRLRPVPDALQDRPAAARLDRACARRSRCGRTARRPPTPAMRSTHGRGRAVCAAARRRPRARRCCSWAIGAPGARASVDAALARRRGAARPPSARAAGTASSPSALGFPDTARASRRGRRAGGGRGRARRARSQPGDRYAFERLFRDRLGVAWPEGVRVREVTAALAEAVAAGRLRFTASRGPPYPTTIPATARASTATPPRRGRSWPPPWAATANGDCSGARSERIPAARSAGSPTPIPTSPTS